MDIRGLQERAARACPAEYVEELDGWLLRYAPRCGWWIGSVLPHGGTATGAAGDADGTDRAPGMDGADRTELAHRAAAAEEFYVRRGAVTQFEISPGACPAGLDELLAERGYRSQASVSLQIAHASRVAEHVPPPATASRSAARVRVEEHPAPAWFDVWRAVNAGSDGHDSRGRGEWEMLARVRRPSAFAAAMIGDDIVAVGRAVADGGWAGVFGMSTLPAARGRGAAAHVLAALAGWAGEQSIDHMYLQVERDNPAALKVYERAGFRDICTYHYRTAPYRTTAP